MNLVSYTVGKISLLTFKLSEIKWIAIYFYVFIKMCIQKDTKIQIVNKEPEFSAHIKTSFLLLSKKDFRLDDDDVLILFSFFIYV